MLASHLLPHLKLNELITQPSYIITKISFTFIYNILGIWLQTGAIATSQLVVNRVAAA